MPLKAIVRNIDEIDETHRGLYIEKNGMFMLDVEAAEGFALEDISGLKNSLSAARGEKRQAEERLKALEAQQRKSETKGDPADAIAGQLIERHRSEMERVQAELAKTKGQLRHLTVERVIQDELARLNPLDDARDILSKWAAEAVRIREAEDGTIELEVVDDRGNPRIRDTQGNPMGVADLLAEMRERRPSLFKAEQKPGLGLLPEAATTTARAAAAHQQTVNNPFDSNCRNISEQMRLIKTNPTLAKHLAEAVGVTVPGL